jgi:hypothetical protein
LGITAFFAVAALLCTGASLPAYGQSSSSGRIGPSGGEVAGAAIGIGAAIAVAIILPIEISRSHHILTGCVASSTNGLELQTSDGKTYALEGDAATIKVGDKVKVHGSRIKKAKGSASPGVFRVEKLNRDYGSCSVESTSSSPAH